MEAVLPPPICEKMLIIWFCIVEICCWMAVVFIGVEPEIVPLLVMVDCPGEVSPETVPEFSVNVPLTLV